MEEKDQLVLWAPWVTEETEESAAVREPKAEEEEQGLQDHPVLLVSAGGVVSWEEEGRLESLENLETMAGLVDKGRVVWLVWQD